jgi:flagellin
MDKSMQKLASGQKINNAADDSAGLAVSEKMRSQIRGLQQASRNAQDGVSLVQTAEGYLQESTSVLQRVRELSIQAANGIYTSEDRQQIQVEVDQLVDEIDRISNHAEFNKLPLLRGAFAKEAPAGGASAYYGGGLPIHLGSNMDQSEKVYLANMSASALGLASGGNEDTRNTIIKVTSVSTANQAIEQVDKALFIVNKQRNDLGAMQNRFEHAIRGIDNAAENLQAAESQIRDTNMANTMVDFVKNNILSQATSSMLAQANVRPQIVLRILG